MRSKTGLLASLKVGISRFLALSMVLNSLSPMTALAAQDTALLIGNSDFSVQATASDALRSEAASSDAVTASASDAFLYDEDGELMDGIVIMDLDGEIPFEEATATNAAPEVIPETEELVSGTAYYVNPLYEDVITEEDLLPPEEASLILNDLAPGLKKAPSLRGTSASAVAGSLSEAGAILRDGMIDRVVTISVSIDRTAEDFTGVDPSDIHLVLFNEALEESSDPRSGDYLLYQHAGYSVRWGGSSTQLDFTYTVTYYTDYSQEAEVTSRVSEVLQELDLSGKSELEKIAAVYDYITAHVTYDYDNLNDDTYKLKYTAYAALINGTAVCQGYANLFYRLCREAGLPVRIISGIGNGEAHDWNIVRVGQFYYNVDTACDAGAFPAEYDYFLRTDDNFGDHTRGGFGGFDYAGEEFYAEYPMAEEDMPYPATSQVRVTGVTLTPATQFVPYGQTATFSVNVIPENAYDKSITCSIIHSTGEWTTSYNSSSVTATPQGEMGTIELQVTTNDGGYTATVTATAGEALPIASGECGAEGVNATWRLYDGGILTISGTGAMADITVSSSPDGDVYITPWYDYADTITQVIVEEGITHIGDWSFHDCTNITSVDLPDSVTSIGNYTFENCSSLPTVDIPSGVTSIGQYVFSGCSSLEALELPSGVTSIGAAAFYECSSLTEMEIPSGVTVLKGGTFYGCSALQSIVLPDSITEIGGSVLYGCESLESIDIPDNIYIIPGYMLYGCKSLKEITIPAKVAWISQFAFAYCEGLTEIVIPDTVNAYLGEGLFSHCTNLESVRLPKVVADVYSRGMFSYCEKLTEFQIPSYFTAINTSMFEHSGIKEIAIPKRVTKIQSAAFAGTGLTDIFYEGTEDDWNQIEIEVSENAEVQNAVKHFLYYVPFWPIASGECGAEGDNVTWRYYYGGFLVISGTGAMADVENLASPSDAVPVLPWNFFKDSIKQVIVEDGITHIGDGSFYSCNNIISVELPDSVTSIGDYAFSGCFRMEGIDLPDQLESIGTYAFSGCISFTEIELPDSLTSLGSTALGSCKGLTFVRVPDNITSLDGVFRNCSNLERVDLPSGLTSIAGAFQECTSLEEITLPESLTNIGDYTFEDCSSLPTINIPSGVTSIGDLAFRSCSSLETIELPIGLISIGRFAFSGCTSLTEMEIPSGVTVLNTYTLSGCSALQSIVLPDSITSIQEYAFANCTGLTDIYYPGTRKKWNQIRIYTYGNEAVRNAVKHFNYGQIIQPIASGECGAEGDNATWSLDEEGILTISGTGAMVDIERLASSSDADPMVLWNNYKDSIAKVIVEDGITHIGDWNFFGCTNITSVGLPDSVTSIGDSAFHNCFRLEGIDVPDQLESIGAYAFSGCESFTEIELPDSLTTLGSTALGSCTDLTYVRVPDNITILDGVFRGCSNLERVDLPSGLTSITEAFRQCTSLEEIILPEELTNIGAYTFENCSSLPTINIPSGVTSIGDRAFRGCSSLEAIELPSSLTSIGKSAFYGCSSLTEVEIPSGVSELEESTFFGCSALQNIVLPDSITSIGSNLLYGCESLKSIDLPDGVTFIPECALYGCKALTEITIPVNVTMISRFAFAYCEGLTKIIIPDTVNVFLGAGLFSHCINLESVSLPANVAIVEGGELFDYCEKITEFEIPSYFTVIGSRMFAHTGITEIVIPKSVTKFQSSTFAGTGLTDIYYPGTEEEWNEIEIHAAGNAEVQNAVKHFNYDPDTSVKLRITRQPESVEVSAAGETATFTVEAEGVGLEYCWYHKNPGQTQFFKSGAYEPSYSLAVTAARNGRQMYCVITDANGNTVTTDTVTMSIHKETVLQITRQPVSVEVSAAGETATFTVEAEGEGLQYSWYHMNPGQTQFFKSGAYEPSYSLAVTAARNGRKMYCVITDANGNSVTTDTVTMSIHKETVLQITRQPVSMEVSAVGETATFTVEAEGEGLEYCWYHMNPGQTQFFKSGAYNASYSLAVTAARDGRQMYCVVTDANGNSVTTDTVTMSIHKETALQITRQPENVEVSAAGETATFSVEAEGVGLEYCWYHKNPGQTQFFKSGGYDASYSMAVTATRNGRQMYCVITDANGESVTTDIVTMSIASMQ